MMQRRKRRLLTINSNRSPSPLILSMSSSSSSNSNGNKLWDRLGIEEDEEPMWYLINCVATTELDLMRMCRMATADMTEDAVKFVVPLETKTRSHGAKKMVTEKIVKYPGYVFAKLRLCREVYEAIQNLDLCRSWMGTINHKGYKKMPPIPLALNEMEVENFGLEDIETDDDNDDDEQEKTGSEKNKDGIILDAAEEDEDSEDELGDPMYKNVDKKALKAFKGLKVEDMVKVTAQNNRFYNEDGIIRRLKDGRIFVRFYTYGSMFEEWLDPDDVRKLTGEEILRGLGGASRPVTQRDFDEPQVSSYGGRYGNSNRSNHPSDQRQSLSGSTRGGQPRNRRQDRMAERFGRKNYDEVTTRNDRNWNWYKEQQSRERNDRSHIKDSQWSLQTGSGFNENSNEDGVWAEGDVNSQWGRKSQRQNRKENRRVQQQYSKENKQVQSAIDGTADWSAFVTSTATSKDGPAPSTSKDDSADDFFSSLMTDLNQSFASSSTSTTKRSSSDRKSENSINSESSTEDDFFASLMMELNDEKQSIVGKRQVQKSHPASNDFDRGQDDDFFASLEAELGSALDEKTSPDKSKKVDDSKDFFEQLEAELKPNKLRAKSNAPSPTEVSRSLSATDLNSKTVPILKEMLRERGLKIGGTKSELIERLRNSS